MNSKKLIVEDFKVYSFLKAEDDGTKYISCFTYCKINSKFVKLYYDFLSYDYIFNCIDFLNHRTKYMQVFKDLGVKDIINKYSNVIPLTEDDIENGSEEIIPIRANIYELLHNLPYYLDDYKELLDINSFLIDFLYQRYRAHEYINFLKEIYIANCNKDNGLLYQNYDIKYNKNKYKEYKNIFKNQDRALIKYYVNNILINRFSNIDFNYYMSYIFLQPDLYKYIDIDIHIKKRDFCYANKPEVIYNNGLIISC